MAKGPGSVTHCMTVRIFFVRTLIVLLLFVLIQSSWYGAGEGWAADERISNLTVKMGPQGEILVSARLLDAMQGKTVNDIQHGIPKDLFYYVLLMKRQPAWFDEEFLANTVKYTIQYDVLKKRYRVHIRRAQGETNQVVENLQEMTDLISKIDNVKIAEIKKLNPTGTFYVRVKAQMKASRLPFYLKYLLFSFRFWNLTPPGLIRRPSIPT